MADIAIPEEEVPAFKSLVELKDNEFASLASAVASASPCLFLGDYIKGILKKLDEQPKWGAMLVVVVNSCRLMERLNSPAEKAAGIIGQALRDDHKFDPESSSVLEKRLSSILKSSDSLVIVAKALNVMTEHDRIFLNARIISDIRPIFTTSLDAPKAAVIIHNLVVTNAQNNEQMETFFALDDSDLKQLKRIIERAEEKSNALKSMLRKSNIEILEPR